MCHFLRTMFYSWMLVYTTSTFIILIVIAKCTAFLYFLSHLLYIISLLVYRTQSILFHFCLPPWHRIHNLSNKHLERSSLVCFKTLVKGKNIITSIVKERPTRHADMPPNHSMFFTNYSLWSSESWKFVTIHCTFHRNILLYLVHIRIEPLFCFPKIIIYIKYIRYKMAEFIIWFDLFMPLYNLFMQLFFHLIWYSFYCFIDKFHVCIHVQIYSSIITLYQYSMHHILLCKCFHISNSFEIQSLVI